MKKQKFIMALLLTMFTMTMSACSQTNDKTESEHKPLNSEIKEATEHTSNVNSEIYKLLDFSDKQEQDFAQKGLITAPESLEIKSENGNLVWSQNIYKFVQDKYAPDSANPSLWRNTQLNSLYGLFEVTDGVYQVRGYDVANITFVRGSHGWIIFDCTTSVETAKAALELFESNFGEVHI